MGVTKINVSKVISLSRELNTAKSEISSAKNSVAKLQAKIDYKIRCKNNIDNRINGIYRNLSTLENQLSGIRTTVEKCATDYQNTDNKIRLKAAKVKDFYVPESSSKKTYRSKSEKNKFLDAFEAIAVPSNSKLKINQSVSKILSKIFDLDKIKNNYLSGSFGLNSSIFSYLAGLYTFSTTKYTSTNDIIIGGLKLAKDSGKMWNGIYKFYDKTLTPWQAAKLGKRFQKSAGIVSLVGGICGFSAETVNSFKTYLDKNVSGSDKLSQLFKNASAGTDVAKSVVNLKYGQKVLTRNVTAKYQWGVAAKNASKLKNASAIVSVAGVVFDSGKAGAARYGQVTKDGTFDMGDIGEVGISSAVSGLISVVDKGTLGLANAVGLSEKSEEITNGIINFADTKGVEYATSHRHSAEYVNNTRAYYDFANDESNNIVLRVGTSAGLGVGMLGSMALDGIESGISWVGNQVGKLFE